MFLLGHAVIIKLVAISSKFSYEILASPCVGWVVKAGFDFVENLITHLV